jgi:hypothetical protein
LTCSSSSFKSAITRSNGGASPKEHLAHVPVVIANSAPSSSGGDTKRLQGWARSYRAAASRKKTFCSTTLAVAQRPLSRVAHTRAATKGRDHGGAARGGAASCRNGTPHEVAWPSPGMCVQDEERVPPRSADQEGQEVRQQRTAGSTSAVMAIHPLGIQAPAARGDECRYPGRRDPPLNRVDKRTRGFADRRRPGPR